MTYQKKSPRWGGEGTQHNSQNSNEYSLSPTDRKAVAAVHQFARGWKSTLPPGNTTRRSLRKHLVKHHGYTPDEAAHAADLALGQGGRGDE